MTTESQRWLDLCRAMRPELTPAQFAALTPQFKRLRRLLLAKKRKARAS
jgi:hypothetical protein